MNKIDKIIEVKDLSFAYEDTHILKNVNIEINESKFVALIGVNGAGKSTFFNILLGKIKAKKGEICLFGDNIKKNNHYKDIAYISQNSILSYKNFPTTVEEIIKTHLNYLKSKKSVDYYLEMVGLENHKNKCLRQLSGGQLQRVALAIALLKNAKLIILDEPTSGVDKNFSKELFIILQGLSKEGKTILMATHSLKETIEYVDDVACIEHGNCKILNHIQIEKELNHKNDTDNRTI